MSKEEIVAFLNDMIDALTWTRAGLIFLAASMTVILLMLFENRTTLFNRFVDPVPVENIAVPWKASEETKAELAKLVQQDLVGGAVLTEVDLKKNRNTIRFWAVKDPVFKNEVKAVLDELLPQAFFDTDPRNNGQMIQVLNNQFVCVPSKDTIFLRFFPDIDTRYPTVCRLAVPPFSGQFAGMVTIILTRPPTGDETAALKIEMTRVSVELYLRDIQHSYK
jgi:hypothetical protein